MVQKKNSKAFLFKKMLWFSRWFFFVSTSNTRIFGTYSITESITVSRNCLLLSETVCQDPTVALVSFTFFEEPFSPAYTMKKGKDDLSNLDALWLSSDSKQRCNRCVIVTKLLGPIYPHYLLFASQKLFKKKAQNRKGSFSQQSHSKQILSQNHWWYQWENPEWNKKKPHSGNIQKWETPCSRSLSSLVCSTQHTPVLRQKVKREDSDLWREK